MEAGKQRQDQRTDSELGRKVFFLYPPAIVKNDLVEVIFRNDFEIYLLEDHEKAKLLLANHDPAILYVNIDSVLDEQRWAAYLRDLGQEDATKSVCVGLISESGDARALHRTAEQLGLQCGAIALKLDLEQSARIIIDTLEANGAKGKRRHVRALGGENAQFNVREGGQQVSGRILDISVAGMACEIADERAARFKAGHRFTDMQLILRGLPTSTSAHVIAVRPRPDDEPPILVVLFDHGRDGQVTTERIQRFVFHTLQATIGRELAQL